MGGSVMRPAGDGSRRGFPTSVRKMVKDPETTVVSTDLPRKRRGALQIVGLLFRRLIQVLVLAVLVAVALAVGWLRSEDFQVRAIRVVETMLETATGEHATLSRVRVQFW